ISKQHSGEDSALTLGCLNSVAVTRLALGRADEARMIHLEAVETCRRVLGERHSETLRHLVGLADACRSLGRLDEAEAMYLQLRDSNDTSTFPLVQALTGLAIIQSL